MGDLIIKPASSGSLKIQDQAGTNFITTGTSSGLTLDSGVTFPAGHIIQVKFVEFTGHQTIGNGSNGKTFVNIGSGVSGQEFSIDMSVSSGNKIIGFGNVNISASGRYSGIKVFYDSTQIALGSDDSTDRTRVTVYSMSNNNVTADGYVMFNSSFSFNYTPSDTSSHTYKVQAGNTHDNSDYTYINRIVEDGNYAYVPRGYSHFMLMEIAQ